jgi:hypothetical protein
MSAMMRMLLPQLTRSLTLSQKNPCSSTKNNSRFCAYYAPYFTNCADEVQNGDKTEVFAFPYEPEGVELFWLVTRHSALTRNTIPES